MGKYLLIASFIPMGLLLVFVVLFVLVANMVGQALTPMFGFGSDAVRAWMLDTPQPTGSDYYGDPGADYSGDVFNGGQVAFDGYTGAESFACQMPAARGYLTDRYGVPRSPYPNHSGIDYGTCRQVDVPVITPFGGKVVYAAHHPAGYGQLLVIENHGWQIYLAHNNSFLVQVGDIVRAGERVALSGSTGNSSGPHVHLETRQCIAGHCVPRDPNHVLLPGQTAFCDWYAQALPCGN